MPSEQPSSLRKAAEDIRSLTGADEKSIAEQWEERREKNDPYTAEDIQKRIDVIDAQIENLSYDTDIERSMYLAVLERMRLRQQLKSDDASARELLQKDLHILHDLNRRITYWQYEDAAMEELRTGILDYEDYRSAFQLDRPAEAGGIPRNAEMEAAVLAQRDALREVLPKLTLVRRLMITEYRLSLQPNNPQMQQQVASLLDQLSPGERTVDRSQLAGDLREKIRIILGTPSDAIAERKLRTPKVHELHRDAIERHFDAVLERRTTWAGTTSAEAEAQKLALKQEHERLLEHALSFHIRSLSRQADKVALLVRENHFGVPVEDAGASGLSARPYGPLLPRDREEMRKERDGHVQALDDYVRYLRATVLRRDKSVDVPLVGEVPLDPSLIIENIMTTHVIPRKLELAEPIARGSTFMWGVHDTVWGWVGWDWDFHEKRTQAILAPIYERLGLPENYSELSDAEKEKARNSPVVQERLRSVQTIINDFRHEHGIILDRMKISVDTLKTLIERKPPEDLALVGTPVMYDAMPDIAVLRTDEEFAGAYEYIFRQLENDIPGDLHIALNDYLRKLQKNIDLNIDVADIEMQLGNAWIRETVGAALLMIAEYQILRRGLPFAMRRVPAAARLADQGVRAGVKTAGNLYARGNAIRIGPELRMPMAARLATGAALIAAGWRLRQVLQRNARLQELPELDSMLAAIELMQNHGNKSADRYPLEMGYLQNQLRAYLLQKEIEAILHDMEMQYPAATNPPPAVVRMKEKLTDLQRRAREQKKHYQNLFPLTKPRVNGARILFTDPERGDDNVGINIRDIDSVRKEGIAYAHTLAPSLSEYTTNRRSADQAMQAGTVRNSSGPFFTSPEFASMEEAAGHSSLPLNKLMDEFEALKQETDAILP